MKNIFLCFFLFLNIIIFSNENNYFSSDNEKFKKELVKAITVNKSKKEYNIKIVSKVFESLYYSDIEKDIYEVCNNIVDPQNLFPSIEIRILFEILIEFEKNDYPKNIFLIWFNNLKKISSQNKIQQKITDYLNWSNEFIVNKIVHRRYTEFWKIHSKIQSVQNIDENLVFSYENVDIKAYNGTDSINIYNTNGSFSYPALQWNGKNGLVSWENVGFAKEAVNATILSSYNINFYRMMLKIDTVKLHNEFNLKEDIEGNLESHLSSLNTFPVFNSFKNDIALTNIMDYFNFVGGIKQVGNTINGKSSGFNESKLYYKDNTIEIELKSKNIIFKDTIIKVNSGLITISYLGTPVLFNNYVDFKYNKRSKKMDIFGKEIGGKSTLFLNIANGLNIRCDRMFYENNHIQFGSVLVEVLKRQAIIESNNFFDENLFYKFFRLENSHPFSQLKAFERKSGTNFFHIEDYTNFIKQDISNTKSLIYEFVCDGFLKYDKETGYITILDKVDKYLKFANNKNDFDQIRFISQPTKDGNGILYIGDTMRFELFNVEYLNLNEKDKVFFIPNGSLNYYKQGNFSTNGFLNIGPLELYGQKLDFNYNKFNIKLGWIDTMYINVITEKIDKNGDFVLRKINSAIQNFRGESFINDPNNKSGLLDFKQYPIFTCRDSSFIFWDKPYIQNGEYTKTLFYYKIDPFTLDSLSSFKKESIKFMGTFVSGIFEDLRQSVTIQNDFSFGFIVDFQNKKNIYDEFGKFWGKLSLNNSGLIGKGNFAYKLVNAKSDSILFLPNSTISNIKKLNIDESEENDSPIINMENVLLKWYVYKDSTSFTPKNGLIELYKDPVLKLDGLIYEKNLFTGSGKINFCNSLLTSNQFIFKRKQIETENSNFITNDEENKLPLINIDTINLVLEVKKQIVSFDFKDFEKKIEYPANSIYVLAKGGLSLDLNKMELLVSKIDSSNKLKLISTNKDIYDLSFEAQKVKIDKKTKLLTSEVVENIRILNSTIFPDNQLINILNGGKIKTLTNSIINMDTNNFHKVIDAKIDIKSNKNIEGTGNYIYPFNDKKVFMNNININKSYTYIKMNDSLNLNNYFNFFGDFNFYSDSANVNVAGFIKPNLNFKDSYYIKTEWMSSNLTIKSDDIVVPINNLTSLNNKKIGYGVYLNIINGAIYPTFSSFLLDNRDYPLIQPKGCIRFRIMNNMYEIFDLDKSMEENNTENYLGFDIDGNNIFGLGKLNLANYSPQFNISSFGSYKYSLINKQIDVNSIFGIDFFIKENILDTIANVIYKSMNIDLDKPESVEFGISQNENDEFLDDSDNEFIKNIKYIYNDDAKIFLKNFNKKSYKNLKEKYTIKMPINNRKEILFNNVKFHFYNHLKAFVSYGNFNILTIGNNKINEEVEGIIYIENFFRDSKIKIYLEKYDEWIYIKYFNSVLNIFSSNKNIISSIRNLKSKEKEQNNFKYDEISNNIKELKELDDFKFLIKKIKMKPDSTTIKKEKKTIKEANEPNPNITD